MLMNKLKRLGLEEWRAAEEPGVKGHVPFPLQQPDLYRHRRTLEAVFTETRDSKKQSTVQRTIQHFARVCKKPPQIYTRGKYQKQNRIGQLRTNPPTQLRNVTHTRYILKIVIWNLSSQRILLSHYI